MQLILPDVDQSNSQAPSKPQEKRGVVYTRQWVVDLLLDLAGYTAEADLASSVAVEPAAGEGVFLASMARRLVASCERYGRPLADANAALLGYELDPASAARAGAAVETALVGLGTDPITARRLAENWIRVGDFLLEAPTLSPLDYVVGNPPYIRLEDVPTTVATAYRGAYPTMKGRADVYVAFFEAALRILKPDGVCAFICADRWMLNAYGAELRRLITAKYSVEAVIEMHRANAFETDVSAYPAITVLRRAEQGPTVVASLSPTAAAAPGRELAASLTSVRRGVVGPGAAPELSATRTSSWFQGDSPWPCASPDRLSLLQRLEAEYYPLESEGTATRVGIGVATGADDVFITNDPDLVERDRLLPLAGSSDETNGVLAWSGRYLVNPWERGRLVDLGRFPRLAAYLEEHRTRLEGRHVGRRSPREWYRTIDRVDHTLTTHSKLYIPDIKNRIQPILDVGNTYPNHNLYYVRSECWDMEVLGGLLLSDVAQFFMECYSVRMRGGFLRFQAQYLRRIRLPRPNDLSAIQSDALADAFRRYDRECATQIALGVYGVENLPEDRYVGR